MMPYGRVAGITMPADIITLVDTALILGEAMVSVDIIQVVDISTQGIVPVFMVGFPLAAGMVVSAGVIRALESNIAAPTIAATTTAVVFLDPHGRHLFILTPCLLYTSPSPRDRTRSRMPSSA